MIGFEPKFSNKSKSLWLKFCSTLTKKLNGPFPASFSFICLFYQQLIVNIFNKSCRWLDSNPGPLVWEAIALSSVPQPLPLTIFNPQPFTVAANRTLIVDSGSDKMFVWRSVLLKPLSHFRECNFRKKRLWRNKIPLHFTFPRFQWMNERTNEWANEWTNERMIAKIVFDWTFLAVNPL